MHFITGILLVLLVLHISGFLIPLIFAFAVVIVALVILFVVKLFMLSPPEHSVVVDYSAKSISTDMDTLTSHHLETNEPSLTMRIPQKSFDSYRSNLLPTSGLIIKQEPLKKILIGQKTWEMRSVTTKKRGVIALIGKGTKEILGVAEIVDVVGPLSRKAMGDSEPLHLISTDRLDSPDVAKLKYAWVLSNVKRFRVPVAYAPRNGAVRFVNLSGDEIEAIRAQLQG